MTFSNLPGDELIQPHLWARDSGSGDGRQLTQVVDTEDQLYEFNVTLPAGMSIAAGDTLQFIMFENNPSDRPFNYTVEYVRVRFSGTAAFAPTGTGGGTAINQTIPTSSPLSLSQLRNVDDGRN